jgi:hypothetical protein
MQTEYAVPAESNSFRKLLELAEAAGQDTELLRQILWAITAHSHLIAFATAADRLISILDRIPQTWRRAVTAADIESWRPLLAWIVEEKSALAGAIGEHFARVKNTTGHNPLRGSGSGEFPFYAVLCEPELPGEIGERFFLLSGHLLIAHVLAIRENSNLADYEMRGQAMEWHFLPNRVDPAARAVRRHVEDNRRGFLRDLPVELPPEHFAERLEDVPVPNDELIAGDRPPLFRFLQKAHGILDWLEKDGGGGAGSTGGHRWVGGRLDGPRLTVEKYSAGDEQDPYGESGSSEIVRFKPASTQKINARINSDLPPDEDGGDEEILLSDFDCETTKQDAGAHARAAHAKVRHIAKSNQNFSWSYDNLADQEALALIHELMADLKNLVAAADWSSGQQLQAEALFAVVTMLMTGSNITRASGLRISPENRKGPIADLSLVIPNAQPIDRVQWRIKALRPDYKTEIPENPNELRAQVESVDLPDVIGLAPVIRRLLERKGNISHTQALFSESEHALAASAKRWLVEKFPDQRVTLAKISGMLWSATHRITGDPALASCTSGVMDPLARVRLHYTSPWATDIQRYYVKALEPIIKHFRGVAPQPMPGEPWLPAMAAGTVGARLCPTVSAVRSMFERLRRDIEDAADYRDRSGFAEHHNLLTLLAVQWFAYGTTCRAIVTPYLPLSSIDAARGIATLSDKDDEAKHKTRLVWAPPALRKHMAAYDAHLESLKSQLDNPPRALLAEPCLFLGPDLEPLLVRPKTLEPLLNRYLNIRANTHRRFLRTELVERGCTPEVVDAFMGHWYLGEEPFGAFSSFNFEEYVAQLQRYLDPLLRDIGLTHAVPGRLTH